MNNVRISVVVPTYKRDGLLDVCISALVAQDFDPSQFEIVVVDDGNEVKTRGLVERWAEATAAYRISSEEPAYQTVPLTSGASVFAQSSVIIEQQPVLSHLPLIRYIPVTGERHSPAIARNLGWRAAQGEYIAFTDDDCIPHSHWLRRGVETLDLGYDGVTGQMDIPLSDHPTDFEINSRGLMTSEYITANCFYRKALLEAIGGFDEQFEIAWREDTDLFFNALKLNARLVYVPDAVVLHPIRPQKWGVSLGQQRKNYYNALLYKKHPQLYREKFGNPTPLRYYGALASLIGVAAGFITRTPHLAAGSGLVWALITLTFAVQRLRGTSHRPAHVVEMLLTSAMIPALALYWRIRGNIAFRMQSF